MTSREDIAEKEGTKMETAAASSVVEKEKEDALIQKQAALLDCPRVEEKQKQKTVEPYLEEDFSPLPPEQESEAVGMGVAVTVTEGAAASAPEASPGFAGVVAPPPLTRPVATIRSRPIQQPGAYSVDGRIVQRRGPVEGYEPAHYEDLETGEHPPGTPPNDPTPPDIVIGGAVLADEAEDEALETASVALSNHDLIEGEQEVVEGRPDTPKSPQGYKEEKARSWGALFLSILVIGAAVILMATLLPSSSSGDESATTSTNATMEPTVVLDNNTTTSPPSSDNTTLRLFPSFTENQTANITLPPHVGLQVQEPGSAHYWANRWMLQDPNLTTYTPSRQFQRFFMAMFYYATQGQVWYNQDHWLSYNVSECDWYSSSQYLDPMDELMDPATSSLICDESRQLRTLNFSHNNLQGSFPRITHFIPTIRYYDLSHNKLTGTLPILSHQPDLLTYYVHNNDFGGQFVGRFSSFDIRHIKTAWNRLEGVTPLLFLVMKNLTTYDSSNNLYAGPLASEVGTCTDLTHYQVANNLFTGQIHSELGQLTNLLYYNVSNNSGIIGTIPAQFGNLSALEVMDLRRTGLTGCIPTPLCDRYWNGQLEIHANCSQVQCCT